MSLECDIAEIKRLVEQEEPIFKAASPEELRKREEQIKLEQSRELYDNAEEVLPGSVAIIKRKLGTEALVQAAIAYADSGFVAKILEVHPASEDRHSPTYKMRDLDWQGIWTDANTFVEQCKIVGSYNEFDESVAERLALHFKNKEFRLAREGSVAVYLRPITDSEFKKLAVVAREETIGKVYFEQDEESLEDNNILRLWWD